MFDTVQGLPVHVLVVHSVVVLLPLSALGVVAIALVPPWRRRYGVLVLVVTAAATAAVPVATNSGEELADRVGEPERHAELGEILIWYAVPMLVLAVLLVVLDRRTAPGSSRVPVTIVAALAVVAAVGTATITILTGHEGSKAVWEDTVDSTDD